MPGTEGTIFEGPYMSRVGREEFAKHYKGWEPDVQELLKVRSTLILLILNEGANS